jgi:hypothetical protein
MTPPNNPARTAGRKLKKTARPVRTGLPVVMRTYQGIANWATALPVKEIASATNRAVSGRRFNLSAGSFPEVANRNIRRSLTIA